MNVIDDPAIPDDLRDLLRGAASAAPVSPAPIHAVQRRARQRRRRRHSLVAGGAALLLIGAVAGARAVTSTGGSERVQTATPPADPFAGRSAPQPVLAAVIGQEDGGGLVQIPPAEDGGRLVEQTASGSRTWFATTGSRAPTSGVVLADGRRFAVAQTSPLDPGLAPTDAQVVEVGEDGSGRRTEPLNMDAPDGERASARIIGASGRLLIIERSYDRLGTGDEPAGSRIETRASISTYDVDTGDEHHLVDTDGSGFVAAAGNVLVQARGTNCQLEVSALDGSDARTVDGNCEPVFDGLGGLPLNLAVSPDGHRAAVTWTTIAQTGSPKVRFAVVDLDEETSSITDDPGYTAANALAWTGKNELTVALAADTEPASVGLAGTTVRRVPWDLTPAG